MSFQPITILDRMGGGTLHAQLLSSVVAPSTFQIDNASAVGTQLVTMPAGSLGAVFTIENEQILATYSVSGSTITCTIVTRGYNGTVAATHNVGVAVEMHWTKAHMDSLNVPVQDLDQKVNGQVTGNGVINGLIPQTTVTTVVSATSHTISGDQTAIFTVGRVYLFKVVSTWYRGTITAVSFGAGTTTITLSGISLAASGTVVACGFEMSRSVNAPKDQDLMKLLATDPTANPPSGFYWLYFKSDGLYTMDSTGTTTHYTSAPPSATGNGSDGALNVTSGTTTLTTDKVYQYTSVSVSVGATLTIGGSADNKLLTILCQGNFTINGTLDLHGHGALGGPGGTSTASPTAAGAGTGLGGAGAGGGGGGGGGAGGGGTGGNASGTTGGTAGTSGGGGSAGPGAVGANSQANQLGAQSFLDFFKMGLRSWGLGAGGGGGGWSNNIGGGGGTTGKVGANGGGALAAFVGGNVSIGASGLINCNGADGLSAENGSPTDNPGASGPGGGGTCLIGYHGSFTNSGSITVAAGAIGAVGTHGPGPHGAASGTGTAGTSLQVTI